MSEIPYSKNIFLTKTEGSYPKTNEFALDTQGTFNTIGATDPDIQAMATIMQPVTTGLFETYIQYDYAKKLGLRATNKEELLEALMPEYLRKLDVGVLNIFDEDSDEYKAIFPKPRSFIYNNVTMHQKLININSLSLALAVNPETATLKTSFDVYMGLYDQALKDSHSAQINLSEASNNMEAIRIKWCILTYGISGKLMTKYETTPERVDDFFDLTIFDTKQSHIDPDLGSLIFTTPIASQICANMVFDPTKTYQIHNSGFTVQKVGSAPTSAEQVLVNAITFQPDETKIVTGAELGDLLNRYLIIINEDTILTGEIKIKEVETEV